MLELICRPHGRLTFAQRPDLRALAGLLGLDQVFDINFRSGCDGSALRIFLTHPDPTDSEGGPADEAAGTSSWAAALALAMPGFDLVPSELASFTSPVKLVPPGTLLMLDHRLAKSRRPLGREMSGPSDRGCAEWPAQIAIDPPGWAGPDVAALLSGLLSAALPFDLRLRVKRFDLTLNDRLSLSQAVRQFRPDMTLLMEDPFEAKRRLFMRGILEGWQSAIGGWRISLDLSLLESRADPAPICSVAESLLFGVASQEALLETSEAGIVDLSAAVPLQYPLPHLIMPSFETLRHLGVAGHCIPPQARSQNPIPADGLQLGQNAARRQVSVSRSDLQRHMLMIGATGVGKSTLLKQIIRQDLEAGFPLLLVDPHGDLCSDVRALLPSDGPSAPIVLDLAAGKPSFGLDLLNPSGPDRARSANLAANELAQVFQKVLYHDSPEGFGPMWAAYWRNAVLLLQLSEGVWQLTDLDRVFHDSAFRRTLLQSCSDPMVVRFWTGIAMKAGGEASLENLTPYIISKLNALTGSPTIRSMIDGSLPKLDLAAAFDQSRPVLVNLAKGSLGASDALLVGALVTAELMRVLMARCAQPRDTRKPARLYLDEFQTYATDTLAQLMAEGRKTGAEMILASQDLTSFGGSRYQPHVADAILSNVGNLLVFRTGPRDASLLTDWFAPTFTPHDLMRLPDRTFAARLLQNGVPIEPMLVRTHQEDSF